MSFLTPKVKHLEPSCLRHDGYRATVARTKGQVFVSRVTGKVPFIFATMRGSGRLRNGLRHLAYFKKSTLKISLAVVFFPSTFVVFGM